MIYPIYVYGSSVLRQETAEVTPDYPELKELVADMFETMYASDGVGLAAPQIGKNLRMFVIDATMYAEEDPELQHFKKAFINPQIYERFGDEVLFNEGCLSLPGIHEEVSRPDCIRIRYQDENFAEYDHTFCGYAARVIQHEYDHIEGKLFIDHLSPLRKTLLKSKLNAMAKGKFTADYRCKIVK